MTEQCGAFMRWQHHLHTICEQKTGATLVYLALTLPVLIGMAGVAVDASRLFVRQQHLQAAADAAALAAARAIALGQTYAEVNDELSNLATSNGADSIAWNYFAAGKGAQVRASAVYTTFFAAAVGYPTLTAQATASASSFVVGSVDHLLPLTIMCDDLEGDTQPGFTFGAEYTFFSNETTQPGNFGWVSWDGSAGGNEELADNITHPEQSGEWTVGDWLSAGPAVNESALVGAALSTWLNQPVTIPLYDAVSGSGSSTRYRLCSFAEFVLTAFDFSEDGKWVRGSFVPAVARGQRTDAEPVDFGVYNVRLVQ